MGSFWGFFGILGLLLPLGSLALSAVYVHAKAKQWRARDPDGAPRPWVPVLLHVGLALGVDVSLEFAGPLLPIGATSVLLGLFLGGAVRLLSFLAVPVWLHHRLGREVLNSKKMSPARESGRSVSQPSTGRVLTVTAWVIGVTGVLIPWLVGVGVKIWLDANHRPTLPWSGFLNVSLPLLILGTAVQWSFPFLALALHVRFRLKREGSPLRIRKELGTVWIVYVVGVLTAAAVFTRVFWEFDFMYIFVPVGMFVAPPMLLAYGLCRLTLRKRRGGGGLGHSGFSRP